MRSPLLATGVVLALLAGALSAQAAKDRPGAKPGVGIAAVKQAWLGAVQQNVEAYNHYARGYGKPAEPVPRTFAELPDNYRTPRVMNILGRMARMSAFEEAAIGIKLKGENGTTRHLEPKRVSPAALTTKNGNQTWSVESTFGGPLTVSHFFTVGKRPSAPARKAGYQPGDKARDNREHRAGGSIVHEMANQGPGFTLLYDTGAGTLTGKMDQALKAGLDQLIKELGPRALVAGPYEQAAALFK